MEYSNQHVKLRGDLSYGCPVLITELNRFAIKKPTRKIPLVRAIATLSNYCKLLPLLQSLQK